MLIYFYGLIFFFGAALGSFYHVVGYRMPIGLDFVNDRSRCPHCETQLRSFELLPVISYLIQRGRCRTCHTPIKFIYVLSEIISGFLFLWPVIQYGFLGFETGEIFVAWAFASMLIIISVSDIYYQLILDKVLVFFSIVFMSLYVIYPQYSLINGLIGGLSGFLILLAISYIGKLIFKKETLGGGDIKLYAVIGFILGIQMTILSLLGASILAFIYSVIFMKNKTNPIAFGPFISMSAYICLFYNAFLQS